MRIVRVVHGDDIRDHLGAADKPGVVGHHIQTTMGANEKAGMGNVVDTNRLRGNWA